MNDEKIRRRIQNGTIEGGQFGRWWFVDRDSLDEFIEDQLAREAERREAIIGRGAA